MQKQLSAYLDDELSPRQRQRVDKHLLICEECSLLLQELRETSDSVASLRQTAPADLWFAVNARLTDIYSNSRPSLATGWTWRQIHPIITPVAAAIGIALVVCGIFVQIFPRGPSAPSAEYTQMDVYLTEHTQYYSQKMLAPAPMLSLAQQDAGTASTQQHQQSTSGSEVDFYLSVYLGDDEI